MVFVVFMLDFITVLTVWYFFFPVTFYRCFDVVVFVVFQFDFRTVLTV